MLNKKYWIELKYTIIRGKRVWHWQIKCCNGRVKGWSRTLYKKYCLCFNDATSFAKSVGVEVRHE